MSARNLRSTDHYNRDVEQLQRQTLGSYVLNIQHAFDVNVTRTITERFSVSVGVPFVAGAMGNSELDAPLARARVRTSTATASATFQPAGRFWVLPTSRYKAGNISCGAGIEDANGQLRAKPTCSRTSAERIRRRSRSTSRCSRVTGAGACCSRCKASGAFRTGRCSASIAYLANPRDHNDTTSIGYNISAAATPPIAADGTRTIPSPINIWHVSAARSRWAGAGFVGSLAWHVEGLPRYDLIGESHGFRRPGVEMFIEPGLSYAKGRQIFSFSVPIAYYRNRFPNPYTGNAGDATFPNYIFLTSYGFRLGGKNGTSDTALCQ